MKGIRYFQLFTIMLILSLGSLLAFIIPVHAFNRQATSVDIALQDAMTSTGTPDFPVGSTQDTLDVGNNSVNIVESYFYFNFTHKPTEFLKAELSLYFWGKQYPGIDLNLTVCLIEDTWTEDTITWNNAPPKGEVLGYMIYENNTGGAHIIDISNIIEGRTNLSVCIYMELENYVQNHAPIASSETYLMEEQAPQIIWTYMEDATITVINPTEESEWDNSETYTITWNSQGQIEKVRIELYDGILPITNISSYEDNDGAYSWTIPEYLDLSGSNYQIKISDYHDSNVYGVSETFSINKEEPDPWDLIPGYPAFVIAIFALIISWALITKVSKKIRLRF